MSYIYQQHTTPLNHIIYSPTDIINKRIIVQSIKNDNEQPHHALAHRAQSNHASNAKHHIHSSTTHKQPYTNDKESLKQNLFSFRFWAGGRGETCSMYATCIYFYVQHIEYIHILLQVQIFYVRYIYAFSSMFCISDIVFIYAIVFIVIYVMYCISMVWVSSTVQGYELYLSVRGLSYVWHLFMRVVITYMYGDGIVCHRALF